jgi:hypothetical protein
MVRPGREYRFRESGLDPRALARDVVPAIVIMAVALVASSMLPIETDTGLRPVDSSLLVILGSLGAMGWIVVRRLLRSKRRVLVISADSVRVFPPRGLLEGPEDRGAPDLEVPRAAVQEISIRPLTGAAGWLASRLLLKTFNDYCLQTADRAIRFDELRWTADINSLAELERDSEIVTARRRLERSLEAAFQRCGYPRVG